MQLNEEVVSVGFHFLFRGLGALLVLSIAWVLSMAVARVVQRALERTRVELTLARFAGKFVRWTIVMLSAFACLSIFDIETTSFAAVIGSAGIAIGLAVQGTLSNFASGIMLLAVRPYKAGDVITAGGVTGTVYEIDLFRTTLDTADNRRITVPNATIFGTTIENATHHPTRRIDLPVSTDRSADVDAMRTLLTKAAGEVDGALYDPPPDAVLDKLTPAAVEWNVRLWCNTRDYAAVRDRALSAVKRALEQSESR